MPFSFAKNCFFLTGPTASGKTALAISFARKIDAEILSLDSMAVYRDMNIGTAKPSSEERAAVPHHLLDVVLPDEDFSVAQYVELARHAAEDILSRGKIPLFVGGTPLYMKALLYGLFDGPPADAALRAGLLADADQAVENDDPEYLHRRLREVDAEAAERLHPNDRKRLVRALEVFLLTGKPISAFQTQFRAHATEPPATVWTLDWPREELHRRIEARVDAMFAAGLVAEVESLLKKYGKLSFTASQAVGYREVIAMVRSQETDISILVQKTIEEVKAHTRQLARRQCTWFNGLAECRHTTPEAFCREHDLPEYEGLVHK